MRTITDQAAKCLLKDPRATTPTLIYLVYRYQYTRFKTSTGQSISRVDCDSNQPGKPIIEPPIQPLEPRAVICPITGLVIASPHTRQRFVSATQLKNLHRTDRPTFDRVAARFLTVKQAGAGLDQQCYHIAHNIRNAYANQFNNPLRRIKKYQRSKVGQMLLFPDNNIIQVTDRIQAGIEYRKGTRYEVQFI